ncbi:hypothetical protein BDQ17DRAFT_1433279 [Cyathus striatus]|nr:hypothetical protein BDQ17DRAFT_1433279 [Cyathus striatus]
MPPPQRRRDPRRVMAGLKSAISNPHNSEEAKERARNRLNELIEESKQRDRDESQNEGQNGSGADGGQQLTG